MRVPRSLVLALVAAGIAPVHLDALTIDREAHAISGIRNARYCEIIPVKREGFHFVATVYNTLGQNDCPPDIWHKITETQLKKRFDAFQVVMNGPRHFVMDKIIASGSTAEGKTIEAGGLRLTERASIDIGLFDLRREPYYERTILRDTRYVYEADKPVFTLVAPRGERYAMQAYAQIVDKTLDYDELPKLGERLKLPHDWRYEVMTPRTDIVLGAKGEATVIQDDLENTYQKIE